MTKEKKAPKKKAAPKASKPAAATLTQLKAEKELVNEVKKLTKQVENLRNTELIRVYKRPGKFLLFSFLKGLMVGFGSVLGASLLVGMFVYLVSQIQLVPFFGDFVTDILKEIDTNQVLIEEKAPEENQEPSMNLNNTLEPTSSSSDE